MLSSSVWPLYRTVTGNSLLFWEQNLARLLRCLRLDEIKRRILVFALLATLIPSLTMGWLSYVQNTRIMTEKVGEELRVASSQTARELDIWLKQRLYELRVFSSSYEVTENMQKGSRGGITGEPLQRIKTYLNSVQQKFADYEELMVLDAKGQVVTSSAEDAAPVNLPRDWLMQARAGDAIMGNAYWDDLPNKAAVQIAVPINTADDQLLGLLAARLNFHAIETMMQRLVPRDTAKMYLINAQGQFITGLQVALPTLKDTRLPDSVRQAMLEQPEVPSEYVSLQQEKVLGSIAFTTHRDWGVVAEIGKAEAYAQTIRIRNLTLLITLGVLLVIGLSAYLLGVTIVRPLNRLTKGADQVANGNLSVEVPVISGGEVGYLTEVFNYMVAKLRKDQEELAAVNNTLTLSNKELQQLSTTDGLTGLCNRRSMMDSLAREVIRSRRMGHRFAVIMIDIDHFKKYNDTHGHLAGDSLLVKTGALFKESTRSMDLVARYGGEEFLLVLPEHGVAAAMEVAERIRSKVSSVTTDGNNAKEPLTVSIGVAIYPDNGTTPGALIASADAALYEAKKRGRNQVNIADASPGELAAEAGQPA